MSIFSPEKTITFVNCSEIATLCHHFNGLSIRHSVYCKSTKDHGNADGLSRLSTQTDADFDQFEKRENAEILCNIEEAIDGLPITFEHFRNETLKDSTLQSVLLYVQYDNWPKPSRLSSDLIDFYNQKASLCVENDVILLQRQSVTNVVVPTVMRTDVLRLLHEGHWGGTRMKQIARRCIWWPNVNHDVEIIAQNCLIVYSPQLLEAWVRIFVPYKNTKICVRTKIGETFSHQK